MIDNPNSFLTMLLTLPLLSDRADPAFPLDGAEYADFTRRLERAGKVELGAVNADLSEIRDKLGYGREEAYRICLLLDRRRELYRTLDDMAREGVNIVTADDAEYPQSMRRSLKKEPVPSFYARGNLGLMDMPLIGILGISGIKTEEETREEIRLLTDRAYSEGMGIVTGSEPGPAAYAEKETLKNGGFMVRVTAGKMDEIFRDKENRKAEEEGRLLVLSRVHPKNPPAPDGYTERNRLVFGLTRTCFVFSSDGHRGEAEAFRSGLIRNLYVKENDLPGNKLLLGRGLPPMPDVASCDFSVIARAWSESRTEQISLF